MAPPDTQVRTTHQLGMVTIRGGLAGVRLTTQSLPSGVIISETHEAPLPVCAGGVGVGVSQLAGLWVSPELHTAPKSGHGDLSRTRGLCVSLQMACSQLHCWSAGGQGLRLGSLVPSPVEG